MKKRFRQLGCLLVLAAFYACRLVTLPYRWARGKYFPRSFTDSQPEYSLLMRRMMTRGWGCIAYDRGGYAHRDVPAEMKRWGYRWMDGITVDETHAPKPLVTESSRLTKDNSRYEAILREPCHYPCGCRHQSQTAK